MIPVYLTDAGECIQVEGDSPETALKALSANDAAVVIRNHSERTGKPYEAMRYDSEADAWISYPADTAGRHFRREKPRREDGSQSTP